MFRVTCDNCGRFISKNDVFSDRVTKEDVSSYEDHHGEPVYAVTCPSCVKLFVRPESEAPND